MEAIGRKADIADGMSAAGGIAPWKAHEVRWPGMAASVKLCQQPRTVTILLLREQVVHYLCLMSGFVYGN